MPVLNRASANAARPHRDQVSLADALDRILHRGVSLQGNLTIGLADVDLLFLDLRLLLGAVDVIWPDGHSPLPAVRPHTPPPSLDEATLAPPERERCDPAHARDAGAGAPIARDAGAPIAVNGARGESGSSTAQGLVRLVLTLVKLLHEVLERQAVRRMEAGRLTETQIERLGTALLAQAEEILLLQRQFGFADQDLSLDLAVPSGAL